MPNSKKRTEEERDISEYKFPPRGLNDIFFTGLKQIRTEKRWFYVFFRNNNCNPFTFIREATLTKI